MISKKMCPVRSVHGGCRFNCMEEECQLWDGGVYDKYDPGCGLVSRENRRV